MTNAILIYNILLKIQEKKGYVTRDDFISFLGISTERANTIIEGLLLIDFLEKTSTSKGVGFIFCEGLIDE